MKVQLIEVKIKWPNKRSLGKVGAENQVNCVDPGALRNCVNRVSLRGAGIAWEDFRFFEFFFEELWFFCDFFCSIFLKMCSWVNAMENRSFLKIFWSIFQRFELFLKIFWSILYHLSPNDLLRILRDFQFFDRFWTFRDLSKLFSFFRWEIVKKFP